MKNIIIVGTHFIQQFYKDLSNQIIRFGIANSNGYEVYMIMLFSRLQESGGHV